VGIEGTDIKAGVIKVANGNTIDMFGEKLLRAACRASRDDGRADSRRTTAGPQRMGEKQAAIFEEEGIAPAADLHRPFRITVLRITRWTCPPRLSHRHGSAAAWRGLSHRARQLVGPGALPWAERYSQIKSLVDAGFRRSRDAWQRRLAGDRRFSRPHPPRPGSL
jgi:hypothetical protein